MEYNMSNNSFDSNEFNDQDANNNYQKYNDDDDYGSEQLNNQNDQNDYDQENDDDDDQQLQQIQSQQYLQQQQQQRQHQQMNAQDLYDGKDDEEGDDNDQDEDQEEMDDDDLEMSGNQMQHDDLEEQSFVSGNMINSGTGSGANQNRRLHPQQQQEEQDNDQEDEGDDNDEGDDDDEEGDYLTEEQQKELYQQLFIQQQKLREQQQIQQQHQQQQDDSDQEELDDNQDDDDNDQEEEEDDQNNDEVDNSGPQTFKNNYQDHQEEQEPTKPQIQKTSHLHQLQQQLYAQQLQEQLQNPYEDEEDEQQSDQQHQIISDRNELNQDEEDDDIQSEEGDQVNDMSFSHIDYKQQFQQQRQQQQQHDDQDEDDEEQDDEEQQEDEDDDEEDDDQEIGEMKAKFDKIMANFVDENAQKKPSIGNGNQTGDSQNISDFKNKNFMQNMQGLVNGVQSKNKQSYQDEIDEEDQYEAVVEGPDHGNDEQSVNIQIKNKKLFPSKPPIPIKSVLKNSSLQNLQEEQQRSLTPDREQVMRERIQNQQQYSSVGMKPTSNMNNGRSGSQNLRPKSAKQPIVNNFTSQKSQLQSQKQLQAIQMKQQTMPKQALQRPQTATLKKKQQISNLIPQQFEIVNDENCMYDMNQNQNIINGGGMKMMRPQTATASHNVILPKFKRPQTANAKSANSLAQFKSYSKVQKKSDPVSRYQNMQNERKTIKFLKQDNKQGRKLDLDRFHKWSTLVHQHNTAVSQQKKGQVHKFISTNKAPIDDRRDDLRFQLRAKISQKNYVDNQMKAFHYNQEIVQPAHHLPKNKANLTKQQMMQQQLQQLQQQQMQLQQINQMMNQQNFEQDQIEQIASMGGVSEQQLEMLKKQMQLMQKQQKQC
eukprot:403352473